MVSQIERFSRIAGILGKYGFGIALAQLFPGQSAGRLTGPGEPAGPSSPYERMRLAIEELGPTFVKFGQIMSTRSDLLPLEIRAELVKLQDQVTPVPFSEVRPAIEACCPYPGTWLRGIDEVPVAAASIAQVHSAVLRDGTRVALKVQRPGIREVIETDLLILRSIAERIEQVFPDARVYNPTGMVEDFARQIEKELDFLHEARTQERMRMNFRSVPGIYIPRVFPQYSSSRLLVMEYAEGIRIDNVEELSALGLDLHELGARGFHAYLKMIFEDGFFHGDPHPGNLLVRGDGTIVVLDFGIAGTMSPEKQWYFISFLSALLNEDTGQMLRSLEGLGVVIPEENREPLMDDLFILIQDLGIGQTISRFNFALFVTELTEVMRRYRIRVPMNLILLLKVLVMTFDIGIRLDPAFNVTDELSPYLTDLAKKNTIPAATTKRISASLRDAADAVFALPRNMDLLLRRFSTGILRLDIIDKDIYAFLNALDAVSDKLMIGFVVGSLVIGSSVVLKASHVPLPAWVSYLAIFGYGSAVLLGIYVIYHITIMGYRRGR